MIQYARETLDDVRGAGLDELLRRHWREIAHYPDIPLKVDWAAYEGVEAAGKLRAYTARDDAVLVGYAVYFVNRNPHYQSSLQAIQDVLFVSPERRNGRIGIRLIAFADAQLAAEGVQAVYQHSKAAHDIGPILERQGYELVDHLYAKRLDRG